MASITFGIDSFFCCYYVFVKLLNVVCTHMQNLSLFNYILNRFFLLVVLHCNIQLKRLLALFVKLKTFLKSDIVLEHI